MKISVFGQMKIRTLKDKFLDEFGVEIQVLDLNKKPIKDKGPDCLQNLSIVRDNNRGNNFPMGIPIALSLETPVSI